MLGGTIAGADAVSPMWPEKWDSGEAMRSAEEVVHPPSLEYDTCEESSYQSHGRVCQWMIPFAQQARFGPTATLGPASI